MPAPPSPRTERWRLWGGVLGPVAFIAAWALSGTATEGYSPVDEAISELAAFGAPTRIAMTAGFLAFAAGVWAYAGPFSATIGGGTGPALRVAAAATAGAALFPLGGSPWAELHGAFAGSGYVALVAAPILASRVLASRRHHGLALVSVLAGLVGGACLVTSLLSEDNGLWQRLGLTTLDLWLVTGAVILLTDTRDNRGSALRSRADRRGVA